MVDKVHELCIRFLDSFGPIVVSLLLTYFLVSTVANKLDILISKQITVLDNQQKNGGLLKEIREHQCP